MKKILFFAFVIISTVTTRAQTPVLTKTDYTALSSSIQKINFDCYSLVKTEYRYIFDYIKNKPGTCDLYTAMATITMIVHDTKSDYFTTYTSAPYYPDVISCSKIDFTKMSFRSNSGVATMFGGFLNPTTGRLATSLYLKSGVLTTDILLREISATIPNGGKVFTGSVQSGIYQVSAVLTIRNQCINIGG